MTCSDINMNVFLKCLLENNYEDVGGEEKWTEIYNEYMSLRENKSSDYILSLVKDVLYCQSRVFIINKCVEFLANEYSRPVVMELKSCGCKGKFDFSNKEMYISDLKRAITFSKKYDDRAKKAEKEYETYKLRYGNTVVKRKDFEVWAVTLGKYMHTYIDFSLVSPSRWCQMLNEYDRYCEVSHAQDNNMINKKKVQQES